MISDIKSAIATQLKTSFSNVSYRYADDIPQNFKKPSFYITVIDQDYGNRIGAKRKSRISFDVAYFSDKGSAEIKSDCLDKQKTLLRDFDVIGTTSKFQVLNKNARITDNVLHFTFDINYSEIKSETATAMASHGITLSIEKEG